MSSIGDKLKQIRNLRNKTQKEVAEYMGVTRNAYTQWENGSRKINVEQLIKLAKYFNVTLDYFSNERVEKSFFELLTQISMFFDSQEVAETDKDAAYQDIMELYLKHKKNLK